MTLLPTKTFKINFGYYSLLLIFNYRQLRNATFSGSALLMSYPPRTENTFSLIRLSLSTEQTFRGDIFRTIQGQNKLLFSHTQKNASPRIEQW